MCQQSLKLCATASISNECELEVASHAHDDIVFLLIPQPWEADSSSVIKRVGRRFADMRQKKIGAAVVLTEAFLTSQQPRIVALVDRERMPAIFGYSV